MNWKVTDEDRELIRQIAERAKQTARRQGVEYSWHDAMMDVTAAHANGNPLRLAELLAADDFNFSHDVFGIAAHLDHETGRLTDCFRPRYSARGIN